MTVGASARAEKKRRPRIISSRLGRAYNRDHAISLPDFESATIDVIGGFSNRLLVVQGGEVRTTYDFATTAQLINSISHTVSPTRVLPGNGEQRINAPS